MATLPTIPHAPKLYYHVPMSGCYTSPETGMPMRRGVRPLTLTYKGESIIFYMPGWYGDLPGVGVHTGDDMKISDRMLNQLKTQVCNTRIS